MRERKHSLLKFVLMMFVAKTVADGNKDKKQYVNELMGTLEKSIVSAEDFKSSSSLKHFTALRIPYEDITVGDILNMYQVMCKEDSLKSVTVITVTMYYEPPKEVNSECHMINFVSAIQKYLRNDTQCEMHRNYLGVTVHTLPDKYIQGYDNFNNRIGEMKSIKVKLMKLAIEKIYSVMADLLNKYLYKQMLIFMHIRFSSDPSPEFYLEEYGADLIYKIIKSVEKAFFCTKTFKHSMNCRFGYLNIHNSGLGDEYEQILDFEKGIKIKYYTGDFKAFRFAFFGAFQSIVHLFCASTLDPTNSESYKILFNPLNKNGYFEAMNKLGKNFSIAQIAQDFCIHPRLRLLNRFLMINIKRL